MLKALIPMIEMSGYCRLDPNLSRINELLVEVATALKNDDDLDERLRVHILRMLEHVRSCLDDFEIVEIFDLGRAITELEFLVAADQSMSKDSSSVWQKLREKLSVFTSNPMAVAVTTAIANGAVKGMIEE